MFEFLQRELSTDTNQKYEYSERSSPYKSTDIATIGVVTNSKKSYTDTAFDTNDEEDGHAFISFDVCNDKLSQSRRISLKTKPTSMSERWSRGKQHRKVLKDLQLNTNDTKHTQRLLRQAKHKKQHTLSEKEWQKNRKEELARKKALFDELETFQLEEM